MRETPYILAVDIGTSSTKTVTVALDGRVLAVHRRSYPLEQPTPDRAVQDPDKIVAAVVASLTEALLDMGPSPVLGASFSSAMHSLVAVDEHDRPLTESWTWADRRATPQALRLQGNGEAAALHARTGTPVHPMSPLLKLAWLQENDPDLHRRAARFVSIKEYVLRQLTGEWLADRSIASSSGMYDLARRDWDAPALALAGIDAARLSPLVDTDYVIDRFAGAQAPTALRSAPCVVGATDGPLSNLGLGADAPGILALNLGTSAALRETRRNPEIDADRRLFCYELDRERWVLGGAINNAGILFEWMRTRLARADCDAAADRGDDPYAHLMSIAQRAPLGADGLTCLPFIAGARFAAWRPDSTGAFAGLTLRHGLEHMVRAAIEGLVYCLHEVARSMRTAGTVPVEVRAGGKFAALPALRAMLADALATRVHVIDTDEASALGAARLGLAALGLDDDWQPPHVRATDEPNSANTDAYRQLFAEHDHLYRSLYESDG